MTTVLRMGGVDSDDNREIRESIEASPERYVEIPRLTHGQCHEILQEFLESDWTRVM